MWSGYNHLLKYEVLSKNSEVIRREITEKEGTSLKSTYILDLLSVILIDDFPVLDPGRSYLITPNHFCWWDGFFVDLLISPPVLIVN